MVAAAQESTAVPGGNSAAQPAALGRVTLEVTRAPLHTMLDEIARQSGANLYYSRSVVPLARLVSLSVHDATPVAALEAVLTGTGVAVREWSATQIVLAPAERSRAHPAPQLGTVHGHVLDAKTKAGVPAARVTIDGTSLGATTGDDGAFRIQAVPAGAHTITVRRIGYEPVTQPVQVGADQDLTVDITIAESAKMLDQVVVTGTVAPTEERALPTPISVVSSADITRLGVTDVSKIFRGLVPGAVTMDDGSHDGYPALTLRGGSNFSQSYSDPPVKIYVDGVEMAYTGGLTQIDPSTIDHIEITRGPQASTLYGAGAIVGVIQIFTKKGTAGLSHPQIEVKASAGGQQSRWANTALYQDHSVGVTGGNTDLSYNGRISYTSTGAWLPEYKSQRAVYSGSLGTTIGRVDLQLSGQFSHRIYDAPPLDPPFIDQVRSGAWQTGANAYYTQPWYPDVTRNEGTYGANLTYRATRWWTNRLTLGFDGYDNPRGLTHPRLTTPADTLRAYSEFHRSRASVGYSGTMEARLSPSLASTLTFGVDHWQTHEVAVSTQERGDGTFIPGGTFIKYLYGNTGLFAQEQVAVANAVFLTAGVRGDRNDNFGGDYGTAVAPRFGVSYAGNLAPSVTFKVRSSYGTAIQPPLPIQKNGNTLNLPNGLQLANPQLGPQKQSGYDAGAELYFGEHSSLQATYYNQRVSDLISLRILSTPGAVPSVSQYANLGAIRNTGWEFEGRTSIGRLDLTATYSIFNSTVQRLDSGALGDNMSQYHLGDRLLLIPRSSGGLNASFAAAGIQASAGLTYMGSFRNYDMIAYYTSVLGSNPSGLPARTYIINYPSGIKLNAQISHDFSRSISAFVRVDNLTDSYRFEVYNISAVLGRLTVVGLRGRW